jgi:hypothetical protein
MKKIAFFLLIVFSSCATTNQPALKENQLLLTRKYVGDFVDYRYTGPEKFGDPHIIWIKTTMDTTYGKISAYSQKCEFNKGDRLYIRRNYYSPGSAFGYWIYQIESEDNKSFYRLSEFQHQSKSLIQNWF